ncbi:hypothetical protein [Chitinimonas lacunae]|uniref:Uncharacterized protein n=1 Tax=Chitinimonas lacunae TaxID=1963018 RepID=A0ABV8MYG4_9NEIS
MEKQNEKQEIVVAVLAMALGLLVSLELEIGTLGWLVVTAPTWGGAITALVMVTARDAAVVGEALDQPTQAGEVNAAVRAAAVKMKERGKRGGSTIRQDLGGYGVRLQVRCTAIGSRTGY